MEGQVLNISPIVVWAVALSQLLTFGLTIWGLMSSGNRTNARRIEEHGKRLEGHDLRLGAVEQSQTIVPTSKDMHELELAMVELKGEVKTLSAVIEGHSDIMVRLEAVVGRHENHLLEGGGRR